MAMALEGEFKVGSIGIGHQCHVLRYAVLTHTQIQLKSYSQNGFCYDNIRFKKPRLGFHSCPCP